MRSTPIRIFLIYVLLCLVWGSTWLAIRASLESLTPFISGGIRFLLAAFFILILMNVRGVSLQKDKESVRLYFLMAFFSFVIPYGLVYWAEQFVPSGLASVLFGVYPFFVAIFSYFRLADESIGKLKIIGMSLGFLGIIVIFSDSFAADFSTLLLGMIAVALSGIIQAWIAVTLKKSGKHLNPLSMNFIPMLIAGIVGLIIGFLMEDLSKLKIDNTAVISVTYLALFGSVVTFTSFYWLMKRINVILLSLVAFITPIVALILGWIFYNEILTTEHIIGSILVLAGLLLANLGSIFKQKTVLKGTV
ncbi:MAG TPA: multidrug DMT transporter permease [Ignavibacteriales bacterium]|nr:multidrug DMT transporter permease [Ignavibacteriales bacterium]